MTTGKREYSEQIMEFAKEASEQNRLNRIEFSKPIMPIWKAGVAGLLFATIVVGALALVVYYLNR